MQERFDLYSGIHKGLRHAMQTVLLRLGQVDATDAADVCEALELFRGVLTWIENHLRIENTIIHPAITQKQAGDAVGKVEHDHATHERDFALLRREADALEAARGEGRAVQRARARELYLHFSHFVGENYLHMEFEETEMNALLWGLFTDAELAQILGRILSSEPPEQLAIGVRWMVPALDPEARAMLLTNFRRAAPAEVFEQLLASATAEATLNTSTFAHSHRRPSHP